MYRIVRGLYPTYLMGVDRVGFCIYIYMSDPLRYLGGFRNQLATLLRLNDDLLTP